MSAVDNFTLEPDELDSVIADLERTETSLQLLTTDLESQMKALHDVWEGLAAEAHRAAHAQWNEGLVAMRLALTELRAAARTAHQNYGAAGQANLRMWEEMQ